MLSNQAGSRFRPVKNRDCVWRFRAVLRARNGGKTTGQADSGDGAGEADFHVCYFVCCRISVRARLAGNIRFHQKCELRKRLLPTEVAHLNGDGFGDSCLHDIQFGSARYGVQIDRHLKHPG